MRFKTNAFTLLEMLLSMMILSSLALLCLNIPIYKNNNKYEFMNEYLLLKAKAMCDKTKYEIIEDNAVYPIIINERGNVNKAQSIYFNNQKVIIRLGNGSLFYE